MARLPRLQCALCLAVAQCLQLMYRLGEDMPLTQCQHARQREAVHPALRARRVVVLTVGHPHPADENMPPLMRHDLRCIEVKPVVELLEPPVHEHLHRVHGRMPCDIAGLIEILAVVGTRGHPLRAEEQDVIIPEGEEVWTLPHIAKILQLCLQLAAVDPAVRRLAVDEDTAALLLRLRPDNEIAYAVALKQVGVAKIRRKAGRRPIDDDLLFFHHPRRLRIRTEALHGAAITLRILRVAGVEDAQPPVLLRSAPRVTSVLIMCVARPQGELGHAVGTEVARLRVCPRFIFMRTAEGIPLIENMPAIVVGEPVRIVDQSEWHFEMKAIVTAIGEGEALRQPCVDVPLVKILHSTHSSGRKTTKVRPKATAKPITLTRM